MSQLAPIGIQPAPQPDAAHINAPAPRVGQPAGAEAPRINEVVRHAEALPPPAPRAAQEAAPRPSLAARIGHMALRVLLGIATLGVTEIVGALIRRAEQGEAPAPRAPQPDVPAAAPTPAQFNRSIADGLRSGGLPAPYQAAVGEAVAQLREAFGNDLVPENAAGLSDLPSSYEIRNAVRTSLNAMQDEVTPEALRDIIKEKAAPAIARKASELSLAQAFQTVGHGADASQEAGSLLHANPGLAAELDICLDRAAVDNVLGAWKNDIEAYAAHVKCLSESRNAALEHAVTRLAGEYGIPVDAMSHRLNLGKLEIRLDAVEPEVGTPEADMRQACMDKAEAFIRNKAALLHSVDELAVSPELGVYWKERILADKTLNDPNEFRNAVEVASRIGERKIAGIEELFRSGSPEGDTAYAAMQSLSLSIMNSLTEVHDWRALDGDEKGLARMHAIKALLDRMPVLRTVLENDAALLDALNDRAGEDLANMDDDTVSLAAEVTIYLVQALRTKNVDNAALAASLGDLDTMPALYLAALNQADAAVRASFPALELPEDMLSLTSDISPQVKNALREAVSKAEAPLTPASFAELARQVMNTAAAKIVLMDSVHAAAVEGQPLQRNQDRGIARALLLRHPELNEVFAAGDADTVAAALGELGGELGEIMRVYKDLNAAWTAGEDYIYRRMSEATGLPEEALRQSLSLTGMTHGGTFSYKRAEYIEEIKNPNTSLLAFPGTADIMQEYEGMAERFVSRKGAVYQSVDDIEGLPEDARAELKSNVLTNSVLRMPDFLTRCASVAASMDAAPLMQALLRPTTTENMLALIRQLAVDYDRQSHEYFSPEVLAKMGSDETLAIMHYSLQIFFARHPVLKGAFAPQFAATLDTALEPDLTRLNNALGNPRNTREVHDALKQEYAQLIAAMAILTDMRREK